MREQLAEPLVVRTMAGRLLLTGVVEQLSGAAETGFDVQGRSRTAVFDVNDVPQTVLFRDTTADVIVESLALQLGVTVGDRVAAGVKRMRLKNGRSVRQFLQRLAEVGDWVLTDDPQGRVRMFRLDADARPRARWIEGELPVLSIRETISIAEWRDEIRLRGQSVPVAEDLAEYVAGQLGVEIVAGNSRPSSLVMDRGLASSSADARVVALAEARKRLGRTRVIDIELVDTDVAPGEIVEVEKGTSVHGVFVVAQMTWEVSPDTSRITARAVNPAVYGVAQPELGKALQ